MHIASVTAAQLTTKQYDTLVDRQFEIAWDTACELTPKPNQDMVWNLVQNELGIIYKRKWTSRAKMLADLQLEEDEELTTNLFEEEE
mgnify:CR=1 FL=1